MSAGAGFKTILLIDDVEETRLELIDLIEQALPHTKVIGVSSGPEAYHQLSKVRVSGVLLDRILGLSEDSTSVFETLKSQKIPVLFMSGIHDDGRDPPPGCLKKPVHDEKGRIRRDIVHQFISNLSKAWALT